MNPYESPKTQVEPTRPSNLFGINIRDKISDEVTVEVSINMQGQYKLYINNTQVAQGVSFKPNDDFAFDEICGINKVSYTSIPLVKCTVFSNGKVVYAKIHWLYSILTIAIFVSILYAIYMKIA